MKIAAPGRVAALLAFGLLVPRPGLAQNNAAVQPAASSVPVSIAPGGSAPVRIRVVNNGTTTWRAGSAHRLGAEYTGNTNQLRWSGFPCGGYMSGLTDARVFLCGDVPPGAAYDFSFTVTAPTTASGSLRLAVRMVQDGVQWFGTSSAWTLGVGVSNSAEFPTGGSSVPASILAGGTASVRVRAYNRGSTTWRAGSAHRLGAQSTNQLSWSGFECGGYANGITDARVFLCSDVAPGGFYDFRFSVGAASGATGSLRLAVQMVQDGVQWFGPGSSWTLGVVVPDTSPPASTITLPTTTTSACTDSAPLSLGGDASDDVAVSRVTWSNAANAASGIASGTSAWSASVPLAVGGNRINVTASDAAGNLGSDAITVAYAPSDTAPPVVAISSPTPETTFTTTSAVGELAGSAFDDVGVSSVRWTNAANGLSGTASGTAAWNASIPLLSGDNRITVTARDAVGNAGTAAITLAFQDDRGLPRLPDAPPFPLSHAPGSGLAPAVVAGRIYVDLAANAPQRMRDLTALGVRAIRIEIENATPVSEYQAIVGAAQAAGIEVLALVSANSLAPGSPGPLDGDLASFDAHFVPAYLAALDRTAAMLPTLKYLEVWNEPDVYGFTPMYHFTSGQCVVQEAARRYALLAVRVFETLDQRRRAGAATPRLAAFGTSRQDDRCLRQALFDSGPVLNHRRYYRPAVGLPDGLPADIVAIHGYGNGGKAPGDAGYTYSGGTFADGVNEFLSARFADGKSVINTLPVWYTEVGYSIAQLGNSQTRQRDALTSMFSTLKSHPQVTAAFWYVYRDDEFVGCNAGERFGLRDNRSTGYSPHLAYTAYQAASASAGDVTAPAGALLAPAHGTTVAGGSPITVTGWAIDADGAAPSVEVAVDGVIVATVTDGNAPQPAACREASSARCPNVGFAATVTAPATPGPHELAVRARDGSGRPRVLGRVDLVVE